MTQIYDKIFKRILTLSNVAVVGFINGIFGKKFPPDSKLTYHWTENIKNSLEKTIADTIITVNGAEKFHVEVQISSDSTIALRVFDYGYPDAVKYKKVERDRIVLDFPQSKIIYLEHTSNTPDAVTLELRFGEQGTYEYRVPTMKFLDYSVEDLDKRHMAILLPLCLLQMRREIEKGPTTENAVRLKTLINDGIIKSIEENEKAGNITHEDMVVLIGLLEKLYAHLYGNIEKFKEEGVKDMISDKLILDIDRVMYERDMAIEKAAKEAEKAAKEAAKTIKEAEKATKEAEKATKEAEKAIKKAEQKAAKAEQKAAKSDEKRALEIAKNLLSMGMTIEQAQSATNLPIAKIKRLQNK